MMVNVSNAKKLATWHAIAPTSDVLTVIIMATKQWTAPTKVHLQAYQQDAGTTTLVDMIDQHLGVTITPGIYHHDHWDRHRFSRSQSHSHNPRYRTNSHSDSHRSHSRSFHQPLTLQHIMPQKLKHILLQLRQTTLQILITQEFLQR